MEEVAEPVFVRATAIKVHLDPRDAGAIQEMAQAKRLSREELIRTWLLQKLARRNNAGPTKRRT